MIKEEFKKTIIKQYLFYFLFRTSHRKQNMVDERKHCTFYFAVQKVSWSDKINEMEERKKLFRCKIYIFVQCKLCYNCTYSANWQPVSSHK